MLPGRPLGHEVRVRDQDARRHLVRLEYGDRLAGLHEQRLVVAESCQLAHDRAVSTTSCVPPCRFRRTRRGPRAVRRRQGGGCSRACAAPPPAASHARASAECSCRCLRSSLLATRDRCPARPAAVGSVPGAESPVHRCCIRAERVTSRCGRDGGQQRKTAAAAAIASLGPPADTSAPAKGGSIGVPADQRRRHPAETPRSCDSAGAIPFPTTSRPRRAPPRGESGPRAPSPSIAISDPAASGATISPTTARSPISRRRRGDPAPQIPQRRQRADRAGRSPGSRSRRR